MKTEVKQGRFKMQDLIDEIREELTKTRDNPPIQSTPPTWTRWAQHFERVMRARDEGKAHGGPLRPGSREALLRASLRPTTPSPTFTPMRNSILLHFNSSCHTNLHALWAPKPMKIVGWGLAPPSAFSG